MVDYYKRKADEAFAAYQVALDSGNEKDAETAMLDYTNYNEMHASQLAKEK